MDSAHKTVALAACAVIIVALLAVTIVLAMRPTQAAPAAKDCSSIQGYWARQICESPKGS